MLQHDSPVIHQELVNVLHLALADPNNTLSKDENKYLTRAWFQAVIDSVNEPEFASTSEVEV